MLFRNVLNKKNNHIIVKCTCLCSSMSLTPKISHHRMAVFIQQNIVAAKIPCSTRCGATCYFIIAKPPRTKTRNCGAHLLRSLWMMGWVRLCRYSIPLATSMAMMSLDCRSMSLSMDTSLKQQPDQWSLPITQAASHRSIRRSMKTPPGHTVNRTLGLDRCWQEERLVRRHLSKDDGKHVRHVSNSIK